MKFQVLVVFLLTGLFSCTSKSKVDLLVYNAKVYTVDGNFSIAEAIAVTNGKITSIGTSDSLRNLFEATTETNAQGKFIYPGLIDAHTHFFRYGLGLQRANLVGTKSWEEILEKLKIAASENKEGWLVGRGWDQNDWKVKEFPSKEKLDELFGDRPVFLTRVDGHAAIANQNALDLGGIKAGDTISGGEVIMKNGKLTGVLVDNAVKKVAAQIPEPEAAQVVKLLAMGEKNCFAVGLTTVDDCGLDYRQVMAIDSLQKAGLLKMRVYAMLSDATANYEFLFGKGKIKTDRLNVRSFKVYADGALGSRGASLLEPYTDKPDHLGFLLSAPEHFDSVANIISSQGFQMCTHAIGDSANRTILKTYAKYLKSPNDLRWRIEHAQVVSPADFSMFGAYSVVPSVQPTHASSDMYWAADRLGPDRVKGAYAYKQLLDQNGWMPLGTDFPVEDISPIKTFYAATIRKDDKGWPAQGFQPQNAISRMDALRGMTIWAAKSNFEEGEKGSLEKGKLADFVIMDQDLLKVDAAKILNTKVVATYLNGEKVY